MVQGLGAHSSRGFGVAMCGGMVDAVFDATVPDLDGIRR